MSKRSVAPLIEGKGELVVRRMRVDPREVVFVKGVIEASEGLACVFAESGGDLTIACPRNRALELDRLMEDLSRETSALVETKRSASNDE